MEKKTYVMWLPKRYYEDVLNERKKFVVRKVDKGYSVGDCLLIREREDNKYSGRLCLRRVTYIYFLADAGLNVDDLIVMGIEKM